MSTLEFKPYALDPAYEYGEIEIAAIVWRYLQIAEEKRREHLLDAESELAKKYTEVYDLIESLIADGWEC